MRTTKLIAVLSVTLFVANVALAEAKDMAARFPADSVAYVGWSELMADKQSQSDMDLMKAFWTGLTRFGAYDDEDAKTFGTILDLLALTKGSSGGVALLGVDTTDFSPMPELALVLDAGKNNIKISQFLEKLLEADDVDAQLKRTTHRNETYMLAAPSQLEDATPQLLWGVHGGVLTMTFGRDAKLVLDKLLDAETKLPENPRFKASREKIAVDGVPTLSVYLDVRGGIELLRTTGEEVGEETPPLVDIIIAETGIGAVECVQIECSAEKGDAPPRMGLFIKTDGPRRGLLKLWDHEPLTRDDLALIPQDATWALASNLDLPMLWKEAYRVIAAISPDAALNVDGSLAMVDGQVGFSLINDLLPTLGDTWIFYDAPDHGGFIFTGAVGLIDVRDRDKLCEIFARLVEIFTPLAQMGGAELTPMTIQRDGLDIHYLVVTGLPIPVAPSACFVGDRVAVGLSPQSLAVALTRKPDGTLLDKPFVKERLTKLPKGYQTLSYADNHAAMRSYYGLSLLYATAFISLGAGDDFQPADFPTLPETLETTFDGLGVSTVDDDGILMLTIGSSAGPQAAVGGAAIGASIMLPSLQRSRGIAKRTVTRNNLAGLARACYIYAHGHEERFPESLQQLVDDDTVSPPTLESPFQDGEAYVYITGQGMDDDVRNILIYEKPPTDEGTSVAYLDGHVQFISIERFKEELSETYKRLKRESEIPAEYRE